MPPPKSKSKSSKRQHGKEQQTDSTAETADDHLAQCIFLEESGDKWRAGDAAKAARFYVRAIQAYDEGMAKFGGHGRGNGVDFDMAYNKARIQYQITQHPAVSTQFPLPPYKQLYTALESHRLALQLDPSNPDVLFNTAQNLTSLAEAIQDDAGQVTNAIDAVATFQEAINLFQHCLATQETMYEHHTRQMSAVIPLEAAIKAEDLSSGPEEPKTTSDVDNGSWASIIEPVTKASLQDTALALLDALGSLSLALPLPDPSGLKQIEEVGNEVVTSKLPVYLEAAEDDNKAVAWLTSARFKATLCEAEFKHGVIDVQTYDQRLKHVFQTDQGPNEGPHLAETSPFLCCYADSLVAFAAAIADHHDTAIVRWSRLTKALECFTQASKIPRVENLVTLQVGRGDVELLRCMLCVTSNLPDNLSNSNVQTTLLKNAEVYYRGASALAQFSTRRSVDDIFVSASIKRAVVASLLEKANAPLALLRASGTPDDIIKKVIQEMVDESLVLGDRIQALL